MGWMIQGTFTVVGGGLIVVALGQLVGLWRHPNPELNNRMAAVVMVGAGIVFLGCAFITSLFQ